MYAIFHFVYLAASRKQAKPECLEKKNGNLLLKELVTQKRDLETHMCGTWLSKIKVKHEGRLGSSVS